MTNRQNFDKFLNRSELGKYSKGILNFYVPLALSLPTLHSDPQFMQTQIKAVGTSGINDVVTAADKYMQQKIKKEVTKLHPDWQFWGEEGEDNISTVDKTKPYLLITDPIEGTNNFRVYKDDQWGSVIALVDNKTQEPVVGVVAHPAIRKFYVGIKGQGAHVLLYDEKGSLVSTTPMSRKPEFSQCTYNNSPHFSDVLSRQVSKFFSLGKVQPHKDKDDELEKSRHKVVMSDGNIFVDPESGVLEAIRYRGTIYFKTSNEMAAVFVILEELGGKVTDAYGKLWQLGINTLIAARNNEDYQYLKNLYDKTLTFS